MNNAERAERLKSAIEARNLAPARVSRMAGLGKGAVGDILRNPERQVRATTWRAIASALDVPASFFDTAGGGPALLAMEPAALAHALPDGVTIEGVIGWRIDGDGGRWFPGGGVILGHPGDDGGDGLVIVETDEGIGLRYRVRPYLVAFGADGLPRHDVEAGCGPRVIGRPTGLIRRIDSDIKAAGEGGMA